uniref:Uncharacterized protein n=1 Tax=Anguilla anguilla TaxID=7936 RepID=A0A0E9UH21_ANGAN
MAAASTKDNCDSATVQTR